MAITYQLHNWKTPSGKSGGSEIFLNDFAVRFYDTDHSELAEDRFLEYTNMAGKSFNKLLDSLINHFIYAPSSSLRQVSTLLSQFGADFGETDLTEMIDEKK